MDIKVPTLGESITEATVARWLKKEGDVVAVDTPLVELETDKITIEVNAASAGKITKIVVHEGENIEVGAILGVLDINVTDVPTEGKAAEAVSAAPAGSSMQGPSVVPKKPLDASAPIMSPAAKKIAEERQVDVGHLSGTGKDGRITKEDVLFGSVASLEKPSGPREERVRMTRLRQRIAERLKESQQTAAMLTTFNEVDMSAVMAMRNKYKDSFEKRYGVKLGFMSFFTKAAIQALREVPSVNAEIDGADIIYKNYYNISVAVGTEQGLVVPVLHGAETMGFSEIEEALMHMSQKARNGKLTVEDMSGGTFTISNGGVYGSLMSTPILNPPQSGILGLHKIEKRPHVVGDVIEIRPMMYLALTYDHRIIDGKEAVTFLVRVKEFIENPERLLLNI